MLLVPDIHTHTVNGDLVLHIQIHIQIHEHIYIYTYVYMCICVNPAYLMFERCGLLSFGATKCTATRPGKVQQLKK